MMTDYVILFESEHKNHIPMKKFSLLFLMLTAALFLCQCSDKPKDRRSVDGVQASTLSPDDSVITTSQLAEIGIDARMVWG